MNKSKLLVIKNIIFCALICFLSVFLTSLIIQKNTKFVKSENNYYIFDNLNNNFNSCDIIFLYKDKALNLKNYSFGDITKKQKEIKLNGYKERLKVMNFAINNGFSKEESIIYAFPEVVNLISDIEKIFCFKPADAKLESQKGTGNIFIKEEINGVAFNKNKFFDDFFNILNAKIDKKYINLQFFNIFPSVKKEDCQECTNLRGRYLTNFNTSSESRKNNIKRALESLDGRVLFPNQTLSFNKITGERSASNGYMKAKTIKNGSFYEEFGGGVCQVSSTLYNAALLSNLEIIEVRPHSLPVSYVDPCFDAMVNSGSSDLIIKNNTKNPIIIATSSTNNQCLINIYGEKNEYKINRVSKKVEYINGYEKEIINDYKLVGLDKPLSQGTSKIISVSKPGYKAIGLLEFYKNDVLVETRKIREDIYKPTKEVVLVG